MSVAESAIGAEGWSVFVVGADHYKHSPEWSGDELTQWSVSVPLCPCRGAWGGPRAALMSWQHRDRVSHGLAACCAVE